MRSGDGKPTAKSSTIRFPATDLTGAQTRSRSRAIVPGARGTRPTTRPPWFCPPGTMSWNRRRWSVRSGSSAREKASTVRLTSRGPPARRSGRAPRTAVPAEDHRRAPRLLGTPPPGGTGSTGPAIRSSRLAIASLRLALGPPASQDDPAADDTPVRNQDRILPADPRSSPTQIRSALEGIVRPRRGAIQSEADTIVPVVDRLLPEVDTHPTARNTLVPGVESMRREEIGSCLSQIRTSGREAIRPTPWRFAPATR